MIHLSTMTSQAPGQVLERAQAFFGETGLGLEIKQQTADSVLFQGGGGYVHVRVSQASETADQTTVDLESREWEYQVEQFLSRV